MYACHLSYDVQRGSCMNYLLGIGWTIGVLEFDSRRGLGIFFFTAPSRTALGPTRSPIQWVPGALSLGVECSGREADHSPPSSAEVKECAKLYLHFPNTPSWRGAQLKHRNNFTFYLYYLLIGKPDGQRPFGRPRRRWEDNIRMVLGK
jgi:hypothetical protein